MTDSQALDGNAIAGTLVEVFGGEMTTAIGVCGHCGARGPVAEVVVYTRAPGVVVRCRACDRPADGDHPGARRLLRGRAGAGRAAGAGLTPL